MQSARVSFQMVRRVSVFLEVLNGSADLTTVWQVIAEKDAGLSIFHVKEVYLSSPFVNSLIMTVFRILDRKVSTD